MGETRASLVSMSWPFIQQYFEPLNPAPVDIESLVIMGGLSLYAFRFVQSKIWPNQPRLRLDGLTGLVTIHMASPCRKRCGKMIPHGNSPMVPDAGESYHANYTIWYLRRTIPYRLRPRWLFLEGAIYLKCTRWY